ncbi:MAG: hypothetical protein ACTSRN_05200, partial [Alphaproteobacteria bacterium]
MNTENKHSGASLIIVLGLLSVLTVLAVAFALSMRVERQSGQGLVDRIHAKHLLHTALVRAVEQISTNTETYCYPLWENEAHGAADATCSSPGPNGNPGVLILRGEASNMIPRALWADVTNAASYCNWINIAGAPGITNGRVAFLIVNCSGLLDANYLGSAGTVSADEIILSMNQITNDIDHIPSFYSNHSQHVRYETIAEMSKINDGIRDPSSNLFTYSYDPDPAVYFSDTNSLGFRDIVLHPKLDINSFTNYGSYTNPAFHTNYWQPLTNHLYAAGFTNPAPIAWNIINYLDSDRIPQTNFAGDVGPSDEITEATPLINEIQLQTVGSNTNYEFIIELWFPFFPVTVEPSDNFSLRVQVFTNISLLIANSTNVINNMSFSLAGAFLCLTNSFSTSDPVSSAKPVYILAQVLSGGTIVDETRGAHILGQFTNTISCSVDDPRANGSSTHWNWTTNNSLGIINATPWENAGQGLPVYHKDGMMENIGEIGHIYCSGQTNTTNVTNTWKNIDIMNYANGAQLLDWLTV